MMSYFFSSCVCLCACVRPPSDYNAVDTASAVAIALMTFGTMYPMSVYSGKVLLQVSPRPVPPPHAHVPASQKSPIVSSLSPPRRRRRRTSSASWTNCSER